MADYYEVLGEYGHLAVEDLDRFFLSDLLFCAVGTPVIFTFLPVIVAAVVTIGTGDIFVAKTAAHLGSASRIAAWIHCGLWDFVPVFTFQSKRESRIVGLVLDAVEISAEGVDFVILKGLEFLSRFLAVVKMSALVVDFRISHNFGSFNLGSFQASAFADCCYQVGKDLVLRRFEQFVFTLVFLSQKMADK